MFAQTHASSPTHRRLPGTLYAQVGVETQLAGAGPHQLVAMLFDGYQEAVAQARGALQSGNLEAKGMAIGRAVRIVEEGLRAGLDRNTGGTLARDLDELYGYLTLRLTTSNLRKDDAALQECQRLMQPLQVAWASIGGTAPRQP